MTMVRARELARLGRELQQSHDTLAAVAHDARAGRSPDFVTAGRCPSVWA